MDKRIFRMVAGRIGMQKYFRMMHTLSVYGMNYGNGGDIKKSGEYFAAKYVKTKLSEQTSAPVLFDVGANIGDYALKLAEIFANQKFQVHAFEPSEKTYRKLVENTSAKEGITVNNLGLGEQEAELILYSNSDGSALASVYERDLGRHGISMDKKEIVKLTTIDNYCATHGIGQIHFLKLDIEGHELFALKGAEKLINSKKIDFIQFEFGGSNIDSRTYFRDFWEMLQDKYDFYRIVKNGLYPIKKYSEACEIFDTINYLLELKK